MHGDDLGDASCCITESVVSFGKCVEYGQFGVDFAQAFVVDDEECIDIFAHFFDSVECFVDFLDAFPSEWNGDDSYGKDAHVLSCLCNDWCGSCACSASHSCCDEYHFGSIAQHGLNFVE